MLPRSPYSLLTCLAAGCGLLLAVAPAGAQVLYSSGTISEAFNGTGPLGTSFTPAPAVPASGTTTFSWTNNQLNNTFYGLTGWYSSVGADANGARVSAGSTSAGGTGLYFWGAASTSERAMSTFRADGSGNGFAGDTYIGLQLRNNSATTLTSASIAYDVEQWRRNTTNATTLTLQYLVTSTTGDQLSASGYSILNLTGTNGMVTAATGSSGGGLISTTAASLSLTGISWAQNDFLWLRWVNSPNGSPSLPTSALAVDNFSFSAIPEPSSGALAVFAVAVLGIFRRKFSRPASR